MKTEMLSNKLTEALATTTPPHEVCEGKFGWYPCCRETYKKLKLLNFLLLLSKRQEAAQERYYRKLPQNRVIRKQNKVKLEKPIPLPEPVEPFLFSLNAEKKDAWMVEESYRASRYPKPTKEDVLNVRLLSSARIDELLALAAGRVCPVKEAV